MTEGSFRLGSDGMYRCDAFQEFIWQEHAFGTRHANLTGALTLKQIHSNQVWDARSISDRVQEGDALVTDEPGLLIGVRSADCVPILLLDSLNRAVGAVHAGWRGSADDIVVRAIEKMGQSFGTKAADVYAAIGPCIRACSYEVGKEVADRFAGIFPEWGEEDIATRCMDLPEANRRQLLKAGLKEDRIFDSGLCTTCLPEQFFSYRREPENPGRMVSAIKRLA